MIPCCRLSTCRNRIENESPPPPPFLVSAKKKLLILEHKCIALPCCEDAGPGIFVFSVASSFFFVPEAKASLVPFLFRPNKRQTCLFFLPPLPNMHILSLRSEKDAPPFLCPSLSLRRKCIFLVLKVKVQIEGLNKMRQASTLAALRWACQKQLQDADTSSHSYN